MFSAESGIVRQGEHEQSGRQGDIVRWEKLGGGAK